MPQSEIVPKQCYMPVVVSFIAYTKQAVIVQIAWQECLSRHVNEVVLNVQLEVDLLVECGCLGKRVTHAQNLNSVFARLQVYPYRLRRFEPVELECFQIFLVIVIVVLIIVSLHPLALQHVVAFS
jgi:uncharacterized membrane protein YoaT (DUF817 family)